MHVRQEALPGQVLHPPRPRERHPGPARGRRRPPRRGDAHPHRPPAVEQPGGRESRLGGRPAHLPQAADGVSRLPPRLPRAPREGVGSKAAAADGPERRPATGLQASDSPEGVAINHGRGSVGTKRECRLGGR